jgi:hypothetical protein
LERHALSGDISKGSTRCTAPPTQTHAHPRTPAHNRPHPPTPTHTHPHPPARPAHTRNRTTTHTTAHRTPAPTHTHPRLHPHQPRIHPHPPRIHPPPAPLTRPPQHRKHNASAICFKNDQKKCRFAKGWFFTRKHEQIIKRSTLITFKLAKIQAFPGFYENSQLKASRANIVKNRRSPISRRSRDRAQKEPRAMRGASHAGRG